MSAPYPIRERTSEARISRRWAIWQSAAPLFERRGYRLIHGEHAVDVPRP